MSLLLSPITIIHLSRGTEKKIASMSKDRALQVLGLNQEKGQKQLKKVTDFSEDEILGAFQQECQTLSM